MVFQNVTAVTATSSFDIRNGSSSTSVRRRPVVVVVVVVDVVVVLHVVVAAIWQDHFRTSSNSSNTIGHWYRTLANIRALARGPQRDDFGHHRTVCSVVIDPSNLLLSMSLYGLCLQGPHGAWRRPEGAGETGDTPIQRKPSQRSAARQPGLDNSKEKSVPE